MLRIPCGQTDKQCPWKIICLTCMLENSGCDLSSKNLGFWIHRNIESYFQIRWPLIDKISFCFIMFCPFFLVSCYQCEVHQSFDYLPKGDSPSSLPPLSHEAASPILSHLPFSEKRRYLATQINYCCLYFQFIFSILSSFYFETDPNPVEEALSRERLADPQWTEGIRSYIYSALGWSWWWWVIIYMLWEDDHV